MQAPNFNSDYIRRALRPFSMTVIAFCCSVQPALAVVDGEEAGILAGQITSSINFANRNAIWEMGQSEALVRWMNVGSERDSNFYGLMYTANNKTDFYDYSNKSVRDHSSEFILSGLTGGGNHKNQLIFSSEEDGGSSCNGGTNSEIEKNGQITNCLGEPVADDFNKLLPTFVQQTTISNVYNRPTSQFQKDIRRFSGQSLNQSATGGGSAADNYLFDGRVGAYFAGGGSFGNVDQNLSLKRTAFDTYNQTGTGAVDYRFNEWAVAGLLFNYTGNQNYLALNAGNLTSDSYRFMPFASFIPFDNAYIDVMAGYGYQTYETRQGYTNSANYSSDQALASIDLGYTYPIGAVELTGFAGGSYIGTNVNGYTESGTGNRVQAYNVSSWTSTVGTQVTYAISTKMGIVQPLMRLEWVHGYNAQQNIHIISASGLSVPIPSQLGISDWGNVTAGLQTTLPRGMTAFLNYQGQIMSIGQNNGVMGGLRLEF